MPPREWRLRIEDILDAAARAQRYVEGMELAAFVGDDRTLDAVSRCFGIIGEAVTHVPKEIIAAHPEIPWAEMRAMRNIVVHRPRARICGLARVLFADPLWPRKARGEIAEPIRRCTSTCALCTKRIVAQRPAYCACWPKERHVRFLERVGG